MDKRSSRRRTPEELLADVELAARGLGWVPPQSEEDVLQVEREITESPSQLPEPLRDVKAVFDRSGDSLREQGEFIRPPEDPETTANLARAAREAGRITPEIEESMRRDREAAEREADGETDGPDVR